MFVVRCSKYTKYKKYIIVETPKKDEKIICRTKRITDIFWNCHANTDADIRSRLKLPDDMLTIVKTVTDNFLKEQMSKSDYMKCLENKQ